MQSTFDRTGSYAGGGLEKWITSSLTSLKGTFTMSGMNANLGSWDVGKVTTLGYTFDEASKFTADGLDKWSIEAVKTFGTRSGTIRETFGTTSTIISACNKRKIADAWKSNAAFATTTYPAAWAAHKWCIGAQLNDVLFKQASWDWVNLGATTTATTWGDPGDWNVVAVKDFSHAFSKDRDETGGAIVDGGNPKATLGGWGGDAMSKWTTTSLTSLHRTFNGAASMNVGLGGWDVSKVRHQRRTERRLIDRLLEKNIEKLSSLLLSQKQA
jgi:hypothetical protein